MEVSEFLRCLQSYRGQNQKTTNGSVIAVQCAAPSCPNNSFHRPFLGFFQFPLNGDLARIWALKSGSKDLIAKSVANLRKHYFCSEHFDKSYFKNDTKTVFKTNIQPIPTIFKDEQELIMVSKDTFRLVDHTYHTDTTRKQYHRKPGPKTTKPFNSITTKDLLPHNGNIYSNNFSFRRFYANEIIDSLHVTTRQTYDLDNMCINENFGSLKYTEDFYEEFVENPGTLSIQIGSSVIREFCRLCAKIQPISELLKITEDENCKKYVDMIEFCMPGKIMQNKLLPQGICQKCLRQLEKCNEILKSFIKAEEALQDLLSKKKTIKTRKKSIPNNEPPSACEVSLVEQPEPVATIHPAIDIPLDTEKVITVTTTQPEPITQKLPMLTNVDSNKCSIKYQCLMCCMLFDSKKEVIDHYKETHPTPKQGKIICKVVKAKLIEKNKVKEKPVPEIVTETNQTKLKKKDKYECLICKTVHQHKQALINHTLKYHSSKDDNQVVCRVVKPRMFRLKSPPPVKVTCPRCEEPFTNMKKFRAHMRQHVTYPCEVCGMVFNRKMVLQRHRRTHVAREPRFYNCVGVGCTETFDNRGDLLRHEEIHKGPVENVQCEKCNKIFTSRFLLRKHEQTHESSLCYICGKVFPTFQYLQRHLHSHNNDRPHSCDICHKSFKSTHALKRHKEVHSSLIKCICHICGKQVRRACVRQHMLIHNAVKPHKCEICSARFHRRSNLLQHRESHAAVPLDSYLCTLCDKVLRSKYTFEAHMKRHDGNTNPNECDVCQKRFVGRTQLKIHYRIHTGETPYKCDSCVKSFRSSASLNQHKLIHNNVFPYACNFCERKFRRMQSLIVHRKTHTGERDHKCSICERAFANRGDMLKHEKIHKRNLEKQKIALRMKKKVDESNDSDSDDSSSGESEFGTNERSGSILKQLLKLKK